MPTQDLRHAIVTDLTNGAYLKSPSTGVAFGLPSASGRGLASAWYCSRAATAHGGRIPLMTAYDAGQGRQALTFSLQQFDTEDYRLHLELLPDPTTGVAANDADAAGDAAGSGPSGGSGPSESAKYGLLSVFWDGVPVNDDVWHHVLATWDTTVDPPVLKAYIDGTLQTNPSINAPDGRFTWGTQIPPQARGGSFSFVRSRHAPFIGSFPHVKGNYPANYPSADEGPPNTQIEYQQNPEVTQSGGTITIPATIDGGRAGVNAFQVQYFLGLTVSGTINYIRNHANGADYDTPDSGKISHTGSSVTLSLPTYSSTPDGGAGPDADLVGISWGITGFYDAYMAHAPFEVPYGNCDLYVCGDHDGTAGKVAMVQACLSVDASCDYAGRAAALLTMFRRPDNGLPRLLGGSGYTAFSSYGSVVVPSIFCEGGPVSFTMNPGQPLLTGSVAVTPLAHNSAFTSAWVNSSGHNTVGALDNPFLSSAGV